MVVQVKSEPGYYQACFAVVEYLKRRNVFVLKIFYNEFRYFPAKFCLEKNVHEIKSFQKNNKYATNEGSFSQ